MSGIVGIVHLDGQLVDRRLLRRLTDFLAFRGPDARKVWVKGPVGFGHALLHTTEDFLPAPQPRSLDGQVWITADARIDGRADLIRKLSGRVSADLKNVTDVDLTLYAYHAWGEDCVQHLLGDFAFAIWDGRQQKLFCARDHFGIKPFYYAQVGNSLVFSNTLNCVRMHPQVSDELNDLAIADFLLFEFNQDPATTSFADIQRLPPAHSLTWQDGALKLKRYWTLPKNGPLHYPRPQDYVEHFKELLSQAVAERLRTRQVGVFMSGGLDSPTVAAAARSILAAQGEPFDLRAYNVVYDRLIPDRERYWSDLAAQHLQIPIHHLAADDYKLYARWDQMTWPEPQHRPQLANWVDLINQASCHSRVVLTGEGGDVILLSSSSYVHAQLRALRWWELAVEIGRCTLLYGRFPPVGFRTFLRRLSGKGNVLACPRWLNPDLASRLALLARCRWFKRQEETLPSHPLRPEACQCLRGQWWQDYFEKLYDPGGTGLPVEFRHPLFDLRLINFALALPPLPWCVDKVLLREAGWGVLPEEVRRRPKDNPPCYPEIKLVLKEGNWVDHFRPAPELARYVQKSAIPTVAKIKDSRKILDILRPLSLNFWLKSLRNGSEKK